MITIINVFNFIKSHFKAFLGVFIVLLILLSVNLYNKNIQLKSDNSRISNNISELNTKNSTLTMTSKELKAYIKGQDTKQKVEIDSILKAHNLKIKQLQSYQKIIVNINDTDTILVEREKPILINDSIYQVKFNNVRKCFKIGGYFLSKDSTTKVYIDKLEGTNNIYITKGYYKTFWDYLFFRKGKLITTKTSDCGETTGEEININ